MGPNKGLRYHEKLRKGELELVRQMKPVGYKPRNLSRLLEQKRQKAQQQQQQQQQLAQGTNILTTTTTTVVKTTTTSTTSFSHDPSKNRTNTIPNGSNAMIDSGAPRDVTCTTVLANNPSTNIPPVVSSNSLIKQEDHDHESHKQQLPSHYQVHAISPDTTCQNTIRLPNSTPLLHVQNPNQNQAGSQPTESEIVDFEGMCFHLMSPTRELGINVKLKLLEEFNPSSSLLKLASKYAAQGCANLSNTDTNVASSIPEKIPVTIDTVQNDRPSLLEPFTDILSTAAATSTASTIAALQSAAATSTEYVAVPATPTNTSPPLESRCVDPLDFHSMNVANRI